MPPRQADLPKIRATPVDIPSRTAKNHSMREIETNRRPVLLLLAILDGTILFLAGVAAAWIRFGSDLFPEQISLIADHPGFIAYALLAQLGLAITFDLYRPESWRSRDYVLARMAAFGVTLAAALALGTYLVLQWRFGRGLLTLTILISLPLQTALRFFWYSMSSRPASRRAVLIGDGPIVGALKEVLSERPSPPFTIVRHLPAPDGSGRSCSPR